MSALAVAACPYFAAGAAGSRHASRRGIAGSAKAADPGRCGKSLQGGGGASRGHSRLLRPFPPQKRTNTANTANGALANSTPFMRKPLGMHVALKKDAARKVAGAGPSAGRSTKSLSGVRRQSEAPTAVSDARGRRDEASRFACPAQSRVGARTFLSAERGRSPDADRNVRAPMRRRISRRAKQLRFICAGQRPASWASWDRSYLTDASRPQSLSNVNRAFSAQNGLWPINPGRCPGLV